jgi:hypothetical protein
MATAFTTGASVITSLVADLKAAVLSCTDYANPAGQRVVATTTRGADIVVDLADAAAAAGKLTLGVYRTSALADKLTRYLYWRPSGGATSDTVHWAVSAGKEHLYFHVEGPQAGETNAADATDGSAKQAFFIGDIAPYFAADTVPAVCVVADPSAVVADGYIACHVSRNQANNASWVAARLATLAPTPLISAAAAGVTPITAVQRAASDGSAYLAPWVVYEDIAGLRGRIAKVFYAGANRQGSGGGTDPIASTFSRYTYGSDTYILLAPMRTVAASSRFAYSPWGATYYAFVTDSPLLAVPYS